MKMENYQMRILFEMDQKDYIPNGSVFSRPSARANYHYYSGIRAGSSSPERHKRGYFYTG